MRREKSRKKAKIMGLVAAFCIMTVGYAAFQTSLTINGTATITGKWDLAITSVAVASTNGSAENAKAPTFEKLTANMEANLYEKGDYVIYNIFVKNNGNLNAILNSIEYDESKAQNDAIKISLIQPALQSVLTPETPQLVKVKVEYDSEYTGEVDYTKSSEVKITLNYTQQTQVNQNNE